MKIKLILLVILFSFIIIFLTPCFLSSNVKAVESLSIKIDDKEINFPDQKPFIDENNRVMVPVRFVSEELGASVDWQEEDGKIIIQNDYDLIELTLNSSKVIINDEEKQLDTKTILTENNRTMVPVRFVSEIIGRKVEWQEETNTVIIKKKHLGPKIVSAHSTDKEYYVGEETTAKVLLQNQLENDQQVWLGYSLMDPTGSWYDIPGEKINLEGEGSKKIELNWKVPDEIISGAYSAVFALWDNPPGEKIAANRLYNIEKKNFVYLFNKIETFDDFPRDKWIKRDDGKLGRSILKKDNVLIENSNLKIKLPANSTDGGEIQTKDELSFGSYEVKMKIPDAPSSITGFFLYKEPDYYHEIDIEVYNDPSGKVLLTTYADDSIKNEFRDHLSYDFTADFYKYRIDYYPKKVEFFINDELIKSWKDGYSKEPMRLMINSWFPRWLDGEKHKNDTFLKVDWIRY